MLQHKIIPAFRISYLSALPKNLPLTALAKGDLRVPNIANTFLNLLKQVSKKILKILQDHAEI